MPCSVGSAVCFFLFGPDDGSGHGRIEKKKKNKKKKEEKNKKKKKKKNKAPSPYMGNGRGAGPLEFSKPSAVGHVFFSLSHLISSHLIFSSLLFRSRRVPFFFSFLFFSIRGPVDPLWTPCGPPVDPLWTPCGPPRFFFSIEIVAQSATISMEKKTNAIIFFFIEKKIKERRRKSSRGEHRR